VEERENKLHVKCTDFNSPDSIYVLIEYLKYLSIVIFFDQNVGGSERSRLVTAIARSEVSLP